MRFIGQKALVLVKLAVVLTNIAFGGWIGTKLWTFAAPIRVAESGTRRDRVSHQTSALWPPFTLFLQHLGFIFSYA
jgi:hypothetical protein